MHYQLVKLHFSQLFTNDGFGLSFQFIYDGDGDDDGARERRPIKSVLVNNLPFHPLKFPFNSASIC